MEKLQHFRHILLFEFNKGVKAAGTTTNICAVLGAMPSERAGQENGFLVLRRFVLILVILHVHKRPSGFDEDSLNTLIHNDPCQCTRELANLMNCDHLPSCVTFAFNGQGSEIGCMGTAML